jgi:uncharacterized protein YgiM (DUF1202 family)
MKLRFFALILALSAAAVPARADSTGYAYCGPYDAYVQLYKSTDQIEEFGKLRCNEKVEVITRWLQFFQVRASDGRVGWVRSVDISGAPASPAQPKTPFGLTNPNVAPREDVSLPLNNRNILNMYGMRLGADVIVTKIKSSQCDFDTSPAALQKLKLAGLPDNVIQAMIQAPTASATPAPKPVEFVDIKIPNRTPIEVRLNADVSSETAQEGTVVAMTVVNDVVVNGLTVVRQGSEARARVITITEPGRMGRPGEVSWAMQDVTAVNGDRIPIDFTSTPAGTNPEGGVDGAIAPPWEFRKNKPTVMVARRSFQAVVHGNVALRLSEALAASLTATLPDARSSNAAATNNQPDSQTSAHASVPASAKP